MNGVIATASLLKDSQLDDDQVEHVDIILESGNNLIRIINDFLDYSNLRPVSYIWGKKILISLIW